MVCKSDKGALQLEKSQKPPTCKTRPLGLSIPSGFISASEKEGRVHHCLMLKE